MCAWRSAFVSTKRRQATLCNLHMLGGRLGQRLQHNNSHLLSCLSSSSSPLLLSSSSSSSSSSSPLKGSRRTCYYSTLRPSLSMASTTPTNTTAPSPASASLEPSCAVISSDQNSAASLVSTSANTFLVGNPDGAYTTLRTVRGKEAILEFDTHIQRLLTSSLSYGAQAKESLEERTRKLEGTVFDLLKKTYSCLAAHNIEADEVRSTILLVATSDGDVVVKVHSEPLPPTPKPPVVVEVVQHSRHDPSVKGTHWVRERKEIEENKGKDANEVVLVNPDGSIMEGLSSNFFVVVGDTLQTAPDGAVLSGTLRKVVLDMCKENAIRVVAEAPTLAALKSWDGAFITSTSRLLLPIDVLRLKVGDTEEVPLNSGQSPLLLQLKDLVASRLDSMSRSVPV